jgi:hypothetical protein
MEWKCGGWVLLDEPRIYTAEGPPQMLVPSALLSVPFLPCSLDRCLRTPCGNSSYTMLTYAITSALLGDSSAVSQMPAVSALLRLIMAVVLCVLADRLYHAHCSASCTAGNTHAADVRVRRVYLPYGVSRRSAYHARTRRTLRSRHVMPLTSASAGIIFPPLAPRIASCRWLSAFGSASRV